jgi:hypothetical protein
MSAAGDAAEMELIMSLRIWAAIAAIAIVFSSVQAAAKHAGEVSVPASGFIDVPSFERPNRASPDGRSLLLSSAPSLIPGARGMT